MRQERKSTSQAGHEALTRKGEANKWKLIARKIAFALEQLYWLISGLCGNLLELYIYIYNIEMIYRQRKRTREFEEKVRLRSKAVPEKTKEHLEFGEVRCVHGRLHARNHWRSGYAHIFPIDTLMEERDDKKNFCSTPIYICCFPPS